MTDADELIAVPQARWARIHEGREALPDHANRELRVLEVVVEVARRVVLRPLSVLPYRVAVNANGAVNREAMMSRAINALPNYLRPPTVAEKIAELQRDASYFWVPSETHWNQLSRMLGLPVADLKRAIHRAREAED